MPEKEAPVGEVKRQVTYDYILELYEEIKEKPGITDKEREDQFAVLRVLADHIGEYMVVKYKHITNKEGKKINE